MLESKKQSELLQMNTADKLAANCPRCFGPSVGRMTATEPDIIACLDGNFQHKRHKASSVPITGSKPLVPDIFMEPSRVEAMAEQMRAQNGAGRPADENVVSF